MYVQRTSALRLGEQKTACVPFVVCKLSWGLWPIVPQLSLPIPQHKFTNRSSASASGSALHLCC